MNLSRAIPVLLALSLPALGQEPRFDPAARAAAIAPFLDGQALAVVRLDLTRADVDALATKFAALAKIDAKQLAEPKKELAARVQALTKAGAGEVFAVFSLAGDPMEEPVMVVPVRAGGDTK